MTSKQRLTVTVDPELVAAGQRAVSAGTAASLSAWVNSALDARVTTDRRLAALGAAVADYEAEHGQISDAQISAQCRADRTNALVVRKKARRSGAA